MRITIECPPVHVHTAGLLAQRYYAKYGQENRPRFRDCVLWETGPAERAASQWAVWGTPDRMTVRYLGESVS